MQQLETLSLSAAESELLRTCARTRMSDADGAKARDLIAGPVDWRRLINAAERHAVLPLVATNLRFAGGDAVPADAAKLMAGKLRGHVLENMRLCGELATITSAMRNASIRTISFKGPTLAALAYGNIAMRPFGDLDLLIHPSDVSKAVGVLESLGFPGWEANRDIAAHLRGECEETFIRPDGRLVVDLHWALSRGYLPFAVPFDLLWERAQTVRIGGTDVQTLGSEDLLPFLCLHGGKHTWERLSWVCDVAELIRSQPQLDLGLLLERAQETGSTRTLLLGLELAGSILDVELPRGIHWAVKHDSAVRSIAERKRRQLLGADGGSRSSSPMRTMISTALFHLRMQRRLRDKVRYLLGAAVPNPRDRGTVSLPRGLQFLHFLTRPVRLLMRYGVAAS